ncbi:MAG: sugar phosphate nucleotidyltransferase [Candidatus Burarchaeum sp.]|nr:sugar phosphate nucleotidyltransferase [Candidatus Burarchaeum sp.]MDO8339049.1 sugar phosphate nucleotidyltransferase [Candidatus Burarchaeum sp.]
MRGVILAGGSGTRLKPLTNVTNKHLLPVYDKPMIMYPLGTLLKAGITDILIVTGKESAGDFMKLLGSGHELGCRLTYRLQDESGGIAQALSLAEDFAGSHKFAVILGDNILAEDVGPAIKSFEADKAEATVFLKQVPDAQRFGVADLTGDKVVSIVEKPAKPKSNFAVIGLYLYSPSVFSVIRSLKPSARGEYEITDVNTHYVKSGKLGYHILKGEWTDAGTFESLHKAAAIARNSKKI